MASPKSEFIIEDLISKIYQKKYNDSRLPSKRELASQYHVSRYTIQKAMKQLMDMGLLMARPGSGIFVNEKKRFAIEEGYRISHFMTNYSPARLTWEDAQLLNCKGNTPAFLIRSRGFLRGGEVFVSSKITAIEYECTYVVPFNKDVFRRRLCK